MVRVRFAPSPTGYLHIGGLRGAIYDELFARHHGGTVVLRIEDTDRTRYVEGAVENFLRSMDWAGIEFDEGPYLDENGDIKEKGDFGPYFQSARQDIYKGFSEKMIESGHAYRCFCTAEKLIEMRQGQQDSGQPTKYDRHCREHLSPEDIQKALNEKKPYTVRLKVPLEGEVVFEDAVRGKISFQCDLIDDQVLFKSDGFPTYHLANVVDDHLMEITHVIRGEEWLPSTPKHILLYRALGWEPPVFGHLPLLLNPDRSKLSKRQGDVAVEDYREQGYLPEALVNFIALLGFNPKADQEVYTKKELIEGFDLGKVNKSGAVFNREKLDWLNREYIKKLSDEELAKLAKPYFEKAGLACDLEYLEKVVSIQRERANVLPDLVENTQFLFSEDYELDSEILPWKKSTPEIAKERLSGIREHISELFVDTFKDKKALEDKIIAFVADKGWTNAESLWPLRVTLTGQKASPSPFEVAWVIGKEKTVSRLDRAINLL